MDKNDKEKIRKIEEKFMKEIKELLEESFNDIAEIKGWKKSKKECDKNG